MAKWKVDLAQTVYESCTVYVDAECEDEAADKAYNLSVNEDWRFDYVKNREVISTTLQSPAALEVDQAETPNRED